jgi:hypothetical protein
LRVLTWNWTDIDLGEQACTAAPTEISYNDSEDESKKYRASIEFITRHDWETELHSLISHLRNGDDNDSGGNSDDHPARIAYHKLKALYPNLSREDLKPGKVDFESLCKLEGTELQHLLGARVDISCANGQEFSLELRKHLSDSPSFKGNPKSQPGTQYWPLIKVVKVFVKADILKSGLVLVDLVRNSCFMLLC